MCCTYSVKIFCSIAVFAAVKIGGQDTWKVEKWEKEQTMQKENDTEVLV